MFTPLPHGASGHPAAQPQPRPSNLVVTQPAGDPRMPFALPSGGHSPSSAQHLSHDMYKKPQCYVETQTSKRGRDADQSHANPNPSNDALSVSVPSGFQAIEQNHSPKKLRPNNYVAPTTVPKTFTSAVGSLIKAGANLGTQKSNTRVQLRRQLSGGQLDAFLGQDDGMDVDNPDTRPRSMSF